ncbi:MAG: Uma2 family endonuclease [Acidobacteriota bacterium]|nr:Uma2 family endonuclease [Acidobacteriota bacterium]
MATRIEPLMIVADLDLMPDDGNRYELIEGELIVSRAPGLSHQRVIGNLLTNLNNYLVQNPIGVAWTTPGVIFDEYHSVIPDIVYVSNRRRSEIASGERITGAPELLVEVVSPGTENARRDRIAKRQSYSKYGVQEYWIADPENRSVEIYRLRDQILELIATLTGTDEITSPLLPDFRCEVKSIFAA